MHIPNQMLNGMICPVTLTVSGVGVGTALFLLKQSKELKVDLRWAGITGLIFISQMLNFPVVHGTSGHLIGGVLAAALLGIPRAILSMSLVLLAQAVFFNDGGLISLGANVLNMALIGAGLGGLVFKVLQHRGLSKEISVGIASLLSVLLAAVACTLEVATSGTVNGALMFQSMVPIHFLIGLAEAGLTVVLLKILSEMKASPVVVPIPRIVAICLAGILLLPLASTSPDGFERSVEKSQLGISLGTK